MGLIDDANRLRRERDAKATAEQRLLTGPFGRLIAANNGFGNYRVTVYEPLLIKQLAIPDNARGLLDEILKTFRSVPVPHSRGDYLIGAAWPGGPLRACGSDLIEHEFRRHDRFKKTYSYGGGHSRRNKFDETEGMQDTRIGVNVALVGMTRDPAIVCAKAWEIVYYSTYSRCSTVTLIDFEDGVILETSLSGLSTKGYLDTIRASAVGMIDRARDPRLR